MLTTSRIPLGRAHMLASAIIHDAQRAGLPFESLAPLGSLRRFAPDIGDVSLLGVAPADEHPQLLDEFAGLRPFLRLVARSTTQLTAETERGPVTLQLAAPDHAGAARVWHTGTVRHTRLLQARARERGLTFEGGRLVDATGRLVETEDEETFYHHLGLPFIPPELREGEDEIDVAARGLLPVLVTEVDVRGDLHMHSTWSDGRNPIGE